MDKHNNCFSASPFLSQLLLCELRLVVCDNDSNENNRVDRVIGHDAIILLSSRNHVV